MKKEIVIRDGVGDLEITNSYVVRFCKDTNKDEKFILTSRFNDGRGAWSRLTYDNEHNCWFVASDDNGAYCQSRFGSYLIMWHV